MSEKIVSKIPDYTGEKVGTWPPDEPSGVKGFFWVKEICEGELELSVTPPPPKGNCFGRAPGLILDAIEPYYHPSAQCWVDSRHQLQRLDEATNTTTYDYDKKPEKTPEQKRAEIDKTLKEDRDRSWRVAVEKFDSGNLNLTEKQRAMCKTKNNIIAQQIGKDSFKHNGKEYKLRTRE